MTLPSDLFKIALKPFELLTYKFVTFPNMNLTRSVKFLGRSIIVKYTFNALHRTLAWISPLDHSPGHFGQRIIVIKLILVDFDSHIANYLKNLHRCCLYTCLFMLCKNSLLSRLTSPTDFKHLQTYASPVIGLMAP